MTTVATLPITIARLLSRHEIAEGTMSFRFERPSLWSGNIQGCYAISFSRRYS